jgi:hypothetical protein
MLKKMFQVKTYHPDVNRRLLFVSPEVVVYEASICIYIFIKNSLCKSYGNKKFESFPMSLALYRKHIPNGK